MLPDLYTEFEGVRSPLKISLMVNQYRGRESVIPETEKEGLRPT